MSQESAPQFDDTRKALEFALNYEGAVAPPTMTREMARTSPKKPPSKREIKRLQGLPEHARMLLASLDRMASLGHSRPKGPPRLRDLDGAHFAGFIQAQLDRLDEAHRAILCGICRKAYRACSCGSPCCSGWRKSPEWARDAERLCQIIKDVGDVARIPGKRGLSTSPEMRRAIVEQYLTKNTMTLTAIAAVGRVTLTTAATHRDWIVGYLDHTESQAWMAAGAIFDQVGITGAF